MGRAAFKPPGDTKALTGLELGELSIAEVSLNDSPNFWMLVLSSPFGYLVA